MTSERYPRSRFMDVFTSEHFIPIPLPVFIETINPSSNGQITQGDRTEEDK